MIFLFSYETVYDFRRAEDISKKRDQNRKALVFFFENRKAVFVKWEETLSVTCQITFDINSSLSIHER